MMEMPLFQGMIGGRPKKALYFLGTYNRQHYIYLDPHYVQQATADTSNSQHTYFCGSFRVCKASSIDPSIGLCYYIRDLNELNHFYSGL